MSTLAAGFQSLPVEFQNLILHAQKQVGISITPLQELKGGWSGAVIYLVSVSSTHSGQVEHYVLKLDRLRKHSASDEITRHKMAMDKSTSDFAAHHLARIAFDRVELDGTIAIFYSIAGQSLIQYRPLSSYERQSQLETIFVETNRTLLEEWNREPGFTQAVHPQMLLSQWLGFRIRPDSHINSYIRDVCKLNPDIGGFLIQGKVFPNPWLYAWNKESWGSTRPLDPIIGFQHGDLNTNNILVKFAGDSEQLAGYYLIDFALFQEGCPLLYDQRYLEMSYLILNLSQVSLVKIIDLIVHCGEFDILDPDHAPIELAGVCSVISSVRRAFDGWVSDRHPSLYDDLWGQYWLAGVAAGLSYCHKSGLPDEGRLVGLVFAAANLKQFARMFSLPTPLEVRQLYDTSQLSQTQLDKTSTWSPVGEYAHNLPTQPTAFIGRNESLAITREMLLSGDVRLVTLTGPGGTGKTRLGLQLGYELVDHFRHGVVFVSLADITETDLVVSNIAQLLGVREGGSQPLLENLKSILQDKHVLLILDNFEQVVSAAPILAELLETAPNLKMLVTSRVVLQIRGEHEYQVPPLDVPDSVEMMSLEQLSDYESLRLFNDRAQAVNYAFKLTNENAQVVAEICRRLDGLPLAIELAAARVRLLPLREISIRLNDRLKFLGGGAKDLPARQQTIRNTLDWSYSLLNEDERVLFARLSVFVGGFTLHAAEAICDPDGALDVFESMSSLINNSLVRQVSAVQDQTRYRMLETIREYAVERLAESGEVDVIKHEHASYFTEMMLNEISVKYLTSESEDALAWVEAELDNLRAALSWSLNVSVDLFLSPQLILTMLWFWYRRGYLNEGREWANRFLASSTGGGPAIARGLALFSSGAMAMWQGDHNNALSLMEEAHEIILPFEDAYFIANTFLFIGTVLVNQGAEHKALPMLKESRELFEELDLPWYQATVLVHMGNASLGMGDLSQARTYLDAAHSLSQPIGEKWLQSFVLNNYGEVARVQGDYETARVFYQESERLLRETGDKGDLARIIHSQGYVALHQGDLEQAEARFHESLSMFKKLSNQRGISECLAGLAGIKAEQGQYENGAVLLGSADNLLNATGAAWWPADRFEYERNLKRIQDSLDEDTFAKAWARGQSMTLDQAMSLASIL